MKHESLLRTQVKTLKAGSLQVHPTAQRQLVKAKLAKLRQSLNLKAIGAIHVVRYRVGGHLAYWIIDGQHRWKELIRAGYGDEEIDVILHYDVKSDAEASELFLLLNDRAAVGVYDKFLNLEQIGDEDALAVRKICEDYDLEISRSSATGQIMCISTLLNIMRTPDGETRLRESLGILLEAFGPEPEAVEGKLIAGIDIVLKKYPNGELDIDALTKKLAKFSGGAAGVYGKGKGQYSFTTGKSLPACIANVIIGEYNKSRRTKLDPIF